MTDNPKNQAQVPAQAAEPKAAAEVKSEEQRVLEILEKARQAVKPLAKAALSAEEVDNELLGFCMRKSH